MMTSARDPEPHEVARPPAVGASGHDTEHRRRPAAGRDRGEEIEVGSPLLDGHPVSLLDRQVTIAERQATSAALLLVDRVREVRR